MCSCCTGHTAVMLLVVLPSSVLLMLRPAYAVCCTCSMRLLAATARGRPVGICCVASTSTAAWHPSSSNTASWAAAVYVAASDAPAAASALSAAVTGLHQQQDAVLLEPAALTVPLSMGA
jgi:hypothetical protein